MSGCISFREEPSQILEKNCVYKRVTKENLTWRMSGETDTDAFSEMLVCLGSLVLFEKISKVWKRIYILKRIEKCIQLYVNLVVLYLVGFVFDAA